PPTAALFPSTPLFRSVVVASAGNEGTPPYVTGSPAVSDGVISVAASIDGGATVLAMTVNSPGGIAGSYEAQAGDFGDLDPPTTGDRKSTRLNSSHVKI